MTSSSFFKRVVPLVVTFVWGVALWQAFGAGPQVEDGVFLGEYGRKPWPPEHGGAWAAPLPEGEGSRTWLIIRRTGADVRNSNRPACDGCAVTMRVLFGPDGVAVPGNGFSLSPSSYPLIEEAVAAARRLEFAPATKNGRPVPVWAKVFYECGADGVKPRAPLGRCALTVDKDSARTWDGRAWPVIETNE